MDEKINKLVKKYTPYVRAYILSLRDIRNLGMLIVVIIVLLVTWSGIKSVQTNYGLEKQITKLQQQNDLTKLQNENQALNNAYYQSSQYREVTARENFGLSAPGETELLVPKEVALAHTVKQPSDSQQPTEIPSQPFWQRNFQAWLNFFLHRSN